MREIRSQKMAQAAYPLVEKMQATHLKDEYFKNEESDEKALKMAQSLSAKYRTLALNFPNMILQSGLSQAAGFLLAKGKDEHTQLLAHLAELLTGKDDGQALHSHILQANISEYQLLTRKALDAASWLKRYTQALLEKETS